MYGIQDEYTGTGYFKRLWVAECKYKKQPMTPEEIQKAMEAKQSMRLDEAKNGPKINLWVWVVSTGGFSAETLDFLRKSDVYYTDHPINEMFRLYGGSIKIPIFV